MTEMSENTRNRGPQGGPPLLAPAAAYGALTIAAAISDASGPRPGTAADEVLRYAQHHTGLLHAVAVLVFGAAAPLAIWAATVHRRLRRIGVSAPGVDIALVGGILAAGSLALSGLVTWVLADTAHSLDPAVARALTHLRFGAGAAGFVVPFALLVAGVAVPSLLLGLTPRWLAWTGLVIAAVGMVSTLTLLTSALDPTLPIVRFGGLLWLLAVSVLMAARRPRRVSADRETSAPDAGESAGVTR
jgi:hypothetical protein